MRVEARVDVAPPPPPFIFLAALENMARGKSAGDEDEKEVVAVEEVDMVDVGVGMGDSLPAPAELVLRAEVGAADEDDQRLVLGALA